MNNKDAMSIPKKHTLRHYVTMLGELYGEPPGDLSEYAEDRVQANLGNLDGAIECFRRLLPEGHERKIENQQKAKLASEKAEQAKK